jgi:membrane dipeptidase
MKIMEEVTRKREIPAIYQDSIIVDACNVMALTNENFVKSRDTGLTAIQYTGARPAHDLLPALKDLANVRDTIDSTADLVSLALSADDIREAKVAGRFAIILALQNPKPIGDDLSLLRVFADIGVKVIQLTYNTQNYIGTGCVEPDQGLTRFGRKVVSEMNRLGILIDVGHCGPKTSLDAIECSERPVISSHSNPKAICNSCRNKSDEVIEQLAKSGGVMGIASWSPLTYRGNDRRPTIEDMLDCFDYAIKVAGVDHIGLGSDMCEGLFTSEEVWEAKHGHQGLYPEVTGVLGNWYCFDTWYAEGVESVAQLPSVAQGLLDRGHSEATVRKIIGENYLRVFKAACS